MASSAVRSDAAGVVGTGGGGSGGGSLISSAMRVSAAMAAVASATCSAELRDEAHEIHSQIKEGKVDEDDEGGSIQEDTAEVRAVALFLAFKPRALSVLRDFVSSSSFEAGNPSHADADKLLHDMAPENSIEHTMQRPVSVFAAAVAVAAENNTGWVTTQATVDGASTSTAPAAVHVVAAMGGGGGGGAEAHVQVHLVDVDGSTKILRVPQPWTVDRLYDLTDSSDARFVCNGRSMERDAPLARYGITENRPFTTVYRLFQLRGGMHHASSLRAAAFTLTDAPSPASRACARDVHRDADAESARSAQCGRAHALRALDSPVDAGVRWRAAALVVRKWPAGAQRDISAVCQFADTLFLRQCGQSDAELYAAVHAALRSLHG